MDVNDTVSFGFGSWSSVNALPTLGFSIGSVSAAEGIDYTLEGRLHYQTADARHPKRLHYTLSGRPHYTLPGQDQ